jgi:hypothetical protein
MTSGAGVREDAPCPGVPSWKDEGDGGDIMPPPPVVASRPSSSWSPSLICEKPSFRLQLKATTTVRMVSKGPSMSVVCRLERRHTFFTLETTRELIRFFDCAEGQYNPINSSRASRAPNISLYVSGVSSSSASASSSLTTVMSVE